MSIAQRLVNLSDGLSAEGILSAAKGGTGNTSGVTGTSSPTISAIGYGGDDTATNPAGGATITLTGTNFASGAKVLINSTQVSVVTVVSATQITFTAPALAAGSYILYVVNSDGSTAIAVPGIQYSGTPAWSTAAGTLGTGYETSAVSTTVSATSDSAVTYSVVSGTLPSGVTINASGTISGTSPLVAGSTTYTFTVRATDLELQDTDRSFSLTINPDVVSWSSLNTIALPQNVASTTTLAATSAAGQTVSYAVDTLPTGLTLSGATVSGTPTVAGATTTTATATAAVTGKTAQQTITWTVSIAADTYFPLTTLLLNAENDLVPFATDVSTNNFPVTVFGDTKPNKFNPYTPGYYSNYWDGTGDSLVVTGNGSVVNFGTADFTIETWFYANTLSPQFLILDTCPGGVLAPTNRIYLDVTSDGTIRYVTYQGNVVLISSSAGAVVGKQWTHVALVKSSNQTKLYLNGTQVGSTYADTLNYPSQTNRPILCANGYDGGSYGTTGYLSNLRIVKGTAVYTANFTPPTQPLTAISGTSLLTCQSNRLIDVSTNAFTMTRTGDVAVSGFQPFTPNATYAAYGSAHFDGTGDYLSVPDNPAFTMGAGDFTIECWVYLTGLAQQVFIGTCNAAGSQGSMSFILGLNGTAFPTASVGYGGSMYTSTFGTALVTNQWYHLAGVRNGAMVNVYVNGVKGPDVNMGTLAITDSTETVAIGRNGAGNFEYVTGYISNARIVKGTAVYTGAFTPPTQPLTAITNTQLLTCQTHQPSNNSQFVDNSTLAGPITRFGNTTQGSFSPYGANWSNYLPSAGSTYLFGGSSTSLALGSGNFTLEGWFYIQALAPSYSTLFDWRTNGSIIATVPVLSDFNNNGKLAFVYGNGSSTAFIQVVESSTTMPVGSWFHMALVRSGTTVTMYFNGTSVGSATSSQDFGLQNFNIGNAQSTNYTPSMYVSNVRLVKGSAVYTSAFTPSTTPLTAITNTTLLTCQSPRYVDNSINNIALSATTNVSVQKFSPFSLVTQTPTTHSVYFDGSGDWLTIPNNTGFAFGSGAFTVEMWVYITGSSGTVANYSNGQSSNSNFSWELYQVNSTTMQFAVLEGATQYSSSSSSFSLNTWNHIACVRNNNTLTTYINGVAGGTTANVTGVTVTEPAGSTLKLCSYGNGSSYVTGYLSNVRVVKGTAVYTSNFTPATQPLTAVSGTSLLTCQDATIRDNSTNNFTLTVTGNTVPRRQNPFGSTTSSAQDYTPAVFGGSAYFDGGSDYLALPTSPTYLISTGNFTIECWVYKRSTTFDTILSYSSGSGLRIFVNASGGLEFWVGASNQWGVSGIVPNNTWNHIAFVRTGSTLTGYVNGVNVGTATTSTDYNAGTLNIGGEGTGSPWGGFITDLRITKGQALYTSNFVPPQTPLTAGTNTILLINGERSAVSDKSGKAVLETVGDAKVSTAVKKYGTASMSFDGTGDGLQLPITPQVYLGTTYTVEAWIYSAGGLYYQAIFELCENNTGGFAGLDLIKVGTTISASVRTTTLGTPVAITGGTLVTNTWQHVALSVNAGSAKLFLDGTQIGSTTTFPEFPIPKTLFAAVGRFANGYTAADTNSWNGYIDDFRITKGYARYTANFTPPTSALLTK